MWEQLGLSSARMLSEPTEHTDYNCVLDALKKKTHTLSSLHLRHIFTENSRQVHMLCCTLNIHKKISFFFFFRHQCQYMCAHYAGITGTLMTCKFTYSKGGNLQTLPYLYKIRQINCATMK